MKRYLVTLELIVEAEEIENVEVYFSDRMDSELCDSIQIEEVNVEFQDPDIIIDEEN